MASPDDFKISSSLPKRGDDFSVDDKRPARGIPVTKGNKDFRKILNDERPADDDKDVVEEEGESLPNLMALAGDKKVDRPAVRTPREAKKGFLPFSGMRGVGIQKKEVSEREGEEEPETLIESARLIADSPKRVVRDRTSEAEIHSEVPRRGSVAKTGRKTSSQVSAEESKHLGEDRLQLIALTKGVPRESEEVAFAKDIETFRKTGYVPGEGFKPSKKVQEDVSPFAVYRQMATSKEAEHSPFIQDQPDLSYVAPVGNPPLASPAASQIAEVAPTPRAPYIQQIVNQMIDKLYVVQTTDKTETIITLKHPPIFEGANLIVTSFDTAKKEFNLAFENLTPAAKHLLDLQQNRNDLKLALEEKGYAVHIVITTTQIEHPVLDQGTLAQNDRWGAQDNPQERERQRKKEEQEG